jgi:hypothetical protein
MSEVGINSYDIDILIESIRTHTSLHLEDLDHYVIYSNTLKKIKQLLSGSNDLIALPPTWIEPMVDALESQATSDFRNVVVYGSLAAHIRKMKDIRWEID